MKKDVYKLTAPQMSIYMSEQFTETPINNIIGTMYFKKDIDIEMLKKSVNLLVKNNPAMRTNIVEKEDVPVQYFKNYEPFEIKVHDFSVQTMEDYKNFHKIFSQKNFNLTQNTLFEFVICILPNDEIALIGKFHHLITDAWSLGLIIDNIAINYTCLFNNLEIPENSGSYLDFIQRETAYLESDIYTKNKNFWLNSLKDSEPISLKNVPTSSFEANRKSYELSNDETELINQFCRENSISAYVLFLAVLNIYLYRTTSYNNFTIQTPVLNRLGKEKNTIGMYINMISVQMKNNPDLIVADLLKTISSNSISYFKNSKYPYIHLLEDLRENDNANNYSVVYSFQNMRPNTNFPNLVEYRSEWDFVGYMQDEFVVNITDINNSGTYNISYDYLIELFTEQEIEYIHRRLTTILFEIINNKNKKISEIKILDKNEEKLLLEDFNNTDFKYDETKTIIDLFEKAVSNYPENIALIHKTKKYTYRELNNMANIIANEIENYGIKNSKVAILCKKSALMVASLLGIMKSGNCYIPIDAAYPKKRINYILEDSNCELIITNEKHANKYEFDNKIILENLDLSLTLNYENIATPDNLAYMIYTSGTTGKPKGVKIKHKNIVNTLIWRKDYYKFDEKTVVLQIPSFSFDSSVEDIFTPLISGSTLVVPSSNRMDINILGEEIVKYKVNHFLVVPSLYKILLHEKLELLSTLKFITIAGESFPMTLVKEHFEKLPKVKLINEYGPTENSVCSTYYELTKDDESILIGKPINNCKCYVLDNNLKLLPLGVKGELYVSGPGVSEGYWNKPDLTAERFLDNPYDPEYKMYKTGDVVCHSFNENLEYVGRDDGQVKLHGLRIELKEIEKTLLKMREVSDALVLVRENSSKKEILVAYITSYEKDLDLSVIYEYVRKRLPFYMIPVIVKLDSFPLTPNGKIDKTALPLPETQNKGNALPETELENDILTVAREILENPNLGTTDDFFIDGNADSLSILTINSRLFAKGIKIKTQNFYKYPNVKKLAEFLSSINASTDAKVNSFVIPKTTALPENISKQDLHFNYKNVLLTGTTGFLGIHILDYLLKYTNCMVYCIIREKYNQPPQKRLEKLLEFYFDQDYYQKYQNRIIVLNGELSEDFFALSPEEYSVLQKNVDCIINTAANTRHYGNYQTFKKENVNTVKNLIAFAKPINAVLNHMSTTNVCGNFLVENDINYNFTENDFYIGQNYEDNVYICSKFEAEKLILEEQSNGLKANIFRLGNLMARYSDGVFQKNKFDNAYYTRLLALGTIGVLPEDLKKQQLEFTPIDETAEAIVKLLTIPNLENSIFHIFSDKLISIDLLLKVFEKYGAKCNFTNYDKFLHDLHLQKNEKILQYIISDLNDSKKLNYESGIIVDSSITNQFLNFVSFNWSKIDEQYLTRFFDNVDFAKDIRRE